MPKQPNHLKLKNILQLAKYNHKKEIIKQSSNIKDAHIYCKVNQLSGQISGPLIEYYIKNTYNMIKNNSSLCIGDLKYKNKNIEIKISTGGKENNKFNYVQLRINHNCDYILTAYYLSIKNLKNNGELFIFRLNKYNMKNIILKYGSYAHGTIQKLGIINKKDLNDPKNDKEYAIRPKYGDDCWNELLKYKIDNI
jgi:hypothetical protein